ncbi:MAG: hypothetical protein IJV48_04390 [Ruminococcus sp.]|nr:hypothetical protein [Ruminococcus sp.]
MGIQYFYNFCIADIDDTDLNSDILSAVRKSYFAEFSRIRDKITYDSEGQSVLYDYCIEKDKPLRWTVKSISGALMQEVIPAEDGRYYLCFYRDDKLFKRLLFSKLHTLLKAEYMDDNGAVCRSIEPRKVQGGLCLLYTDSGLSDPVVLSAMPEVFDERIIRRLNDEYTDYSAVASTNDGIIWFLSDEQTAHFRSFVEQAQDEIDNAAEETFVGEETPLYDRINPKDFNTKRNLSETLDITTAKAFGEDVVEEQPAVSDQTAESADDIEIADHADDDTSGIKPDKLIMADGAMYSYFGELDENDNRSGYGRTMTDLGRTAYEGMYRSDKRSGKGAYFYKDGTLCYSGDWSENVRHGVGVGVSARDGSMHIGKWINNKPEGNGVRMTAEGEIKFVCKELSDGGTVLMHYTDDDGVIVSKYDKDGNKLSEKTIVLNDI